MVLDLAEALDQVAALVEAEHYFPARSLSPLGQCSNFKVGIESNYFHSLDCFILGYLFVLTGYLGFRYCCLV